MRDPDARRDRLRAAGPWVLDGLLALAASAVGLSLLASALPFDPGSPRAWAAYLLLLAHTLPLAVRRRWPLAVLVWALATGAAFAAVGPSLVPLSFTILIYVYTAAAHCPRRVSLAGLAATEALLGVVWLARPRSIGDAGTLIIDGLLMVGRPLPSSGRPSWSGPARSWPGGRSPRSGCASPASSMTWSPTA
jgi:hypothetical protein